MLAYIHAALGLLALGASGIRFFESLLAQIVGWLLIAAAAGTMVVGVLRVREMRSRIRDAVGPELPTPPEPPGESGK
jgi:ascorbate-specific PTS system EIIC-type component UlaA